MCGGGSSRVVRHNTTRNTIAKAVRDVGFRTDIEHGGGLGDQRRPGDVIVYNWRDGRHLLIDVAIINPLCPAHRDSLISEGVRGAGTAYGRRKERKYHDLDLSKYEFLPFIMETTGGLSKAAHGFCKEIQKRFESSSCQSKFDGIHKYEKNPLLSAINVELQRANSRMVLERTPILGNLIESAIVKCEISISKKKEKAIESLRLERIKPTTIRRENRIGQNWKDITQLSRRPATIDEGHKADTQSPIVKKMRLPSKCTGKQPAASGVQQYNPYPLPVDPKPPEKGEEDNSSTVGGVPQDWETEERNLAIISNTSQKPSTSAFSDVFRSNSLGQKNGDGSSKSTLGVASISQNGREGHDPGKVHWEPPGARSMQTE